MKVLYGYRNARNELKTPVVAAIGVFDGIHIGHKRVIGKVLSYRGSCGDRVVITFDPHPLAVLRPEKKPLRIMSLEHRISIFERMGLDATVVINFSDFIAMMSPEEFVKNVLADIGARKIYVGSNFHFGRGRSGNIERLREIAARHGMDVEVVNPVKLGRRVASSTWLRSLIARGDLKKAEKLLRRPVSVYGTVVKGDERGRKLGIPTANIDPHQEVLPPPGVYAVRISAAGELYDGVLNIGYRPTFYGKSPNRRQEPLIEAHIMDFDGCLYGTNIEIFFVDRLRREKRFGTEESLIAQVKRDMENARALIKRSRRTNSRIQRYKRSAGRLLPHL